jgi:arsenate reductase-like glutaredoxin family protein
MKAREFLAQKKVQLVERDLMKQPLTEAEVVALGKRLGGLRELVAPKRRAEAEPIPDAKLAKWLADNPNFVRRPLIDTGKQLEAGFTAQTRERLG